METIYNEYYDKVYYWAIKKTNNKEDAEDLTNSVFLSIFEYLNSSIEVKKLENLIWKIAYNLWCTKAKEYIKNNNNVELNEQYVSETNIDMIDKIIYKEIVSNLNNIDLTNNEKRCFELYYFKDLSIKEISSLLKFKEQNIKYYLYNARKKIKERYYE